MPDAELSVKSRESLFKLYSLPLKVRHLERRVERRRGSGISGPRGSPHTLQSVRRARATGRPGVSVSRRSLVVLPVFAGSHAADALEGPGEVVGVVDLT